MLRLFRRYRRFRDLHARDELVRRHLPLARRLARRYYASGDSGDDLVQVASIGLLKAIERFDPERGVQFATFAVPTILGELKRHIRDFGWAVHVSRADKERALRVRCIDEELSGRCGRSATPAEVAAAAGLSVEEVLEASEIASAARPTSLDEGEGDDGEHDGNYPLARLSAEPGEFELVESRDRVARCLRGLSGVSARSSSSASQRTSPRRRSARSSGSRRCRSPGYCGARWITHEPSPRRRHGGDELRARYGPASPPTSMRSIAASRPPSNTTPGLEAIDAEASELAHPLASSRPPRTSRQSRSASCSIRFRRV